MMIDINIGNNIDDNMKGCIDDVNDNLINNNVLMPRYGL
jgi:hypothetical protein